MQANRWPRATASSHEYEVRPRNDSSRRRSNFRCAVHSVACHQQWKLVYPITFGVLTRLSPSYDLVSQQQVSCVFLLNLQTNLPSCTVQQHDDLTSLPVSLQIISAPNTGQISNAAANRPSNAVFIFRFRHYSNPTAFAIKLTPYRTFTALLNRTDRRVANSSSTNAVSLSSARTT